MSPAEFFGSQRFAIILCSVFVATVMLIAVFAVDPAYNYPRMITDQLLYYMKGLSFVNDGTTAARAAVNTRPFVYAAAPGLLRAPLIAAFDNFDDQLRAIQVSNIALGIILGFISAYIVSWALPQRLHWLAVSFSFATLLLNPVWVTNMLSPLADLPYAVASLGALVALKRMIAGNDAERNSRAIKVLFVVLLIIAFGCRYTAPVLLVYGAVLLRQARGQRSAGRVGVRWVFVAVGVALAILFLLDFSTIVFGYLWQPYQFLLHAKKSSLVLNTLVLAIPSQVIPGLELLYQARPQDMLKPAFGTNPFDMGLLTIGLLITGAMAYGMWRGRRQFRAEMVYVLLPLPVLAPMIPSTARYLLSYQPLIWLFFCLGAAAPAAFLARRVRQHVVATAGAIAICCVAVASLLYIRSSRVTGADRVTISSFSLGEGRRHASEVAQTYRSLRQFLESRPRDRTLILGDRAATGQWKVIAGIDYYEPDSALSVAARARDIYLVMACHSQALCSHLPEAITKREDRILYHGAFAFDSVFAARNDYSAAVVFRLRAEN